MEAHGIPGEIQTLETVYTLLKEHYTFVERGTISIRSKGEMPVYLLIGRRDNSITS